MKTAERVGLSPTTRPEAGDRGDTPPHIDDIDAVRHGPTVRLVNDGTDIRVYGLPYPNRHLVADLPQHARRWTPTLRCWVVDLDYRGQLHDALDDAGYHIQHVNARPTGNSALVQAARDHLRRAHASSPLMRKANR